MGREGNWCLFAFKYSEILCLLTCYRYFKVNAFSLSVFQNIRVCCALKQLSVSVELCSCVSSSWILILVSTVSQTRSVKFFNGSHISPGECLSVKNEISSSRYSCSTVT